MILYDAVRQIKNRIDELWRVLVGSAMDVAPVAMCVHSFQDRLTDPNTRRTVELTTIDRYRRARPNAIIGSHPSSAVIRRAALGMVLRK
jgi:hypothetical protein